YIPWRMQAGPVPHALSDPRAREARRAVLPGAERACVSLNVEDIFTNGFLFSPGEMISFVDGFNDESVGVHFDTGNIMQYQFPEHWIRILGKRIKNVHLKEFTKKGTDSSLESFRPLLD